MLCAGCTQGVTDPLDMQAYGTVAHTDYRSAKGAATFVHGSTNYAIAVINTGDGTQHFCEIFDLSDRMNPIAVGRSTDCMPFANQYDTSYGQVEIFQHGGSNYALVTGSNGLSSGASQSLTVLDL